MSKQVNFSYGQVVATINTLDKKVVDSLKSIGLKPAHIYKDGIGKETGWEFSFFIDEVDASGAIQFFANPVVRKKAAKLEKGIEAEELDW